MSHIPAVWQRVVGALQISALHIRQMYRSSKPVFINATDMGEKIAP